MKKTVSIALVISIIFSLLAFMPTVASAADGETLSVNNGALLTCKTDKTFFEIPDGVTEIAENAFIECFALEEIYIGNGVTSIRSNAFVNCPRLKLICIAGTQDINIVGRIANCDVMILINNENKGVRKSIAMAKKSQWSSFAVYEYSGKTVLAYLYGASNFSVKSVCGQKLYDLYKPYYILLNDSGKYYDVHNTRPEDIQFQNSANPGFGFKFGMKVKHLSYLSSKADIEKGGDGVDSFFKRLLNLFRK